MGRCDAYRQLVREGEALLRRINTNGNPQDANCPETADAVNDFLNGEGLRTVRAGGSTSIFRFPPGLRWSEINLTRRANGMPNCSHLVVRGSRAPGADGVTSDHYFVVLRVDGTVYVADAYTQEFVRGVEPYVNAEAPDNRMVRFATPIGARYDISVENPLDSLR